MPKQPLPSSIWQPWHSSTNVLHTIAIGEQAHFVRLGDRQAAGHLLPELIFELRLRQLHGTPLRCGHRHWHALARGRGQLGCWHTRRHAATLVRQARGHGCEWPAEEHEACMRVGGERGSGRGHSGRMLLVANLGLASLEGKIVK